MYNRRCVTVLWVVVFFSPSFAKLCSMTVACAISFVLNKSVTFLDHSAFTSSQLLKFMSVQLINICCNVFVNYLVLDWTSNYVVAFILATFVATILNFFLQKKFVFKTNYKIYDKS